MPNEVIIAAAGGGKTTQLATRAKQAASKVAVIAYTNNSVDEITAKLYALGASIPENVEIWSWYSFLLQELARPYQNEILTRRIEGLSWVEGRSARGVPRAKPGPFFLNRTGNIYSDKLSQFIVETNAQSGGRVVKRLEQRFQTILIDEVQDLAGWDLELIQMLLRSKIEVSMVGDHRQATYSTNNALKNKAYAGAKILDMFRKWEKAKLLTVTYANATRRCNQQIADLADTFYPADQKTVSRNLAVTGHDGVFLLSPKAVDEYVETYNPQILRLDRKTKCDDRSAMNFGESKGMTFDRVLIYPHGKGKQWLTTGDYKQVMSVAAKMYVGITRARYSVAFVHDGPSQIAGLVRYPIA